MSGPVDVLAVLGAEIERAGGEAYQAGRDLIEARAAVAKLIEATRELIDFAEPQLRDYGFGYMGKFEKARKALANIGGAK